MEIKRYRIAWKGSLYDPGSADLVANLEELVASVNMSNSVVIEAVGGCHDFDRDWYLKLSESVLYEEVLAHCDRVFKLFARIASSSAKWIFLFTGDCLGSWWDLALSCHARVGIDSYSKVGFPEFQIDLAPPLSSGSFGELPAYASPELARRNAVITTKEAYAQGLVSLVLRGEGWLENGNFDFLSSWIEKSPRQKPLYRTLSRKELLDETPDILGTIEQRATLKERRKQVSHSYIGKCFSVLQERNLRSRLILMSDVRAGAVSRFFFPNYLAWLGRRITRYLGDKKITWVSRLPDVIVIDCNPGVPPQALFEVMVARKMRLLLVAGSETVLKERVEAIISRSAKGGLAKTAVLESWRARVNWAVMKLSQIDGVVLRFCPNDMFEICSGEQLLVSRYRLSGNFGQSVVGWCEQRREHENQIPPDNRWISPASELADLLTSGCLSPAAWPFQIPLSVCLRFLLLDEMRHLSQSGRWPDVVEQCKLLAASGWGFAADIPQWDNLLRHFRLNRDLPAGLSALGARQGDYKWSASLVDERSSQIGKQMATRLDVSSPRLTRYFEAFSTKVLRKLLLQNILVDEGNADLFLTLAWGYPGSEPVPSAAARDFGEGWAELLLSSERAAPLST